MSQWSLLKEDKERLENSLIRDRCDYFGIPDITGIDIDSLNDYESNFVRDFRRRLKSNSDYPPSPNQMKVLNQILNEERVEEPSTYKQQRYLIRLGYEGEVDSLSKPEASRAIDRLLNSKENPE